MTSILSACADEQFTPEWETPDLSIYSVYVGEIDIENRSQFPYTQLYLHPNQHHDFMMNDNLLSTPFNPGDRLKIQVVGAQYVTAFRPRVEGGPLWRIQSTRPVSFYTRDPIDNQNVPNQTPSLWLLDQGFLVIDALSDQ